MRTVQSFEEVPKFASEAEEAEFWASHELGDELVAQMRPHADRKLPNRQRTRPIAIRFDENTLARVKDLAQRRGKGYQTLLKEFVAERLYEEEKREGVVGK
jgi:predicted DNA binding CopG/RHH family protein